MVLTVLVFFNELPTRLKTICCRGNEKKHIAAAIHNVLCKDTHFTTYSITNILYMIPYSILMYNKNYFLSTVRVDHYDSAMIVLPAVTQNFTAEKKN